MKVVLKSDLKEMKMDVRFVESVVGSVLEIVRVSPEVDSIK